jgi:hypothetical protein
MSRVEDLFGTRANETSRVLMAISFYIGTRHHKHAALPLDKMFYLLFPRELVTKTFQEFINVSCKLISKHLEIPTQAANMLKFGMNVEAYE